MTTDRISDNGANGTHFHHHQYQEISPTLAEFLKVPFYTKMYEEDIVLMIWEYILKKNLFIDQRMLLLDKNLTPVIHPKFFYGETETHLEHSFVMIYIAKMHQDPAFIERDVRDRLDRIARNIAARKILRFYRKHRGGDDNCPPHQLWLRYLVHSYGENLRNGNGDYHRHYSE